MGGVIRKTSDKGTDDPFIARMWIQVYHIRDSVFSDEAERRRFDQAYEPIRTNLEQCLAARNDIQALWDNYRDEVLSGTLVRIGEETVHIDKTIDIDLERKVKEFFNRGKNALDLLDKLKRWSKFSPSRFNKSEKEFAEAKDALLASTTDTEDRQWHNKLVEYLERQRMVWLTEFTKMRIEIEHRGWNLSRIEFEQLPDGRIAPLMPHIGKYRLDIMLNMYWNFIFDYCETMVVPVALRRHVRYPRVLVEIPPEDRDPAFPIRFDIRVDMG